MTPAVKYSKRVTAGGTGTDDGTRTDVGGIVTYKWDDDRAAYVLVQTTVSRSGDSDKNDRVGVGGKTALTEKIDLVGEVSAGTSGPGAQAGLDYRPTADDHYYLGYRLDPERFGPSDLTSELDGNDLGVFVSGAQYRFNDQLSAFGEDTYDVFGERRSLTQTYGVTYTPAAKWKFGGALEVGTIADDTMNSTTGLENSDFDRIAASLSTTYHGENGIEGYMKGEVRFENSGDDTRDRNSYLLGSDLNIQTSEDWRLLTSLDAVLSELGDGFTGWRIC